jgi:hypothetical protein
MSHRPRQVCRAIAGGIALLAVVTQSATLDSASTAADGDELTKDPVVARVYEHFGDSTRAPGFGRRFPAAGACGLEARQTPRRVSASSSSTRPNDTCRCGDLSGARLGSVLQGRRHIAKPDHHSRIRLVPARRCPRPRAPMTEREALLAEAAQLRRCLFCGPPVLRRWLGSGGALQTVQAKLHKPREHY